jgi:putative ABC transport system permease protein
LISWSDTFASALEAVRSHRLRSALTALGILIGIASVVLTVGLGLGAQSKVQDQIAALGSNLLIVSPGSSTNEEGVRGGFGSGSSLTTADAAAIADPEAAPDVAAVVPVSTSSQVASAGGQNWTTELAGTTPHWSTVRNRALENGRFFTQEEADRAAPVVVLAPDTATELFGSTNAVGETLTVSGTAFTVIGVLERTGATGTDASENDMALVPLAAAYQVTGSTSGSVSTLYVQARSEETLAAAYQEVQNLLTNLHGVAASERDFTIATQGSLIETANETNRTMTMMLGGVAAISLLVGGIGVMNIMLVSVTERVKEIGLRKALGGAPSAIRRQFLVEAGVLGLIGGVAGITVGVIGAVVLPGLIDQPVTLSGAAIATALIVSLGLGVGFGVYPASRAAQLLPIQALRSD